MYSNINVVRCVSIILEKIYSEPSKYFQFKDKEGKTLPPPKRENFKHFLIKTLTKYSIVRSQIGIFHQKSRLTMGSSLSSILSNIFVHSSESKIVQKYKNTGKIKFYSRFADDSLLIIHKNSVRSFLKEINGYDKSLNFTVNHMDDENSIKFLYINIFLSTENKIEFKKYRKNSVDTVICNFEHSISSPKYKKGSILTNIHREFDATCSQENFLETLEELKEVYS